MTAAVPSTAGQLVTSERGVCGGPLAFHYANLMSHTAFRQSLACVSLLYQLTITHDGLLIIQHPPTAQRTPTHRLSPLILRLPPPTGAWGITQY
jgi:hypothetical protein